VRWSSAAREKIWEQKLVSRSSLLCVVMSVKKTVSETGNELSDTALLLCTLNLESESVGLYSSQLNSIRSDTSFYGGHEKFCVSTREADEHLTKISATAFGQSLTNGAVWNYTGFDNH